MQVGARPAQASASTSGSARIVRAPRTLSAAQARRIAVAAQQLAAEPVAAHPDGPSAAAVRRVVERLGVVQLDSVNVLARAHRLPVFSRLGAYRVDRLEAGAWPSAAVPPNSGTGRRRSSPRWLVETWAHEASLVPVDLHPLLRWPRRHWSAANARRVQEQLPGLLDDVLAVLRERGPSSAGEIERELEVHPRGEAGWWEWSATKRACEALFSLGVIGAADRVAFERRYDLIEAILPAHVLAAPTPEPADAQRELVRIAARSLGVATVGDLADYFRMSVADTKRAVADLVEDGAVQPVVVTGWPAPAYLDTAARIPRRVSGVALVSPFDPLVWYRERTERIFGFRYRIEIYTPAPKRIFGYYVLPLLVGDHLAGRFDLKADRAAGRLLVQASWYEPGSGPGDGGSEVAEAAAGRLAELARWLELDEIEVRDAGNVAGPVRAAVGRLDRRGGDRD
ncbi:winged helix-turn-helix domain-containing protein [Nakamurella leprariae]|uniref:YcaQ family DNA glycosylase n=1 Tax=Nakamurella leprariae TaxID=2803911 RepID=A0A938YE46_9ACTN|nr:crosslink repair DNA glycosylase YcaQ family protein [Nakamurella leprariae]MBM9466762.1 YcaQ family DNA glycosylase [Nakamurella leprariae]